MLLVGRNIAIRFQNCVQSRFNFTIILILGAMNDRFHIDSTSMTFSSTIMLKN